jgi:hypothetical protein
MHGGDTTLALPTCSTVARALHDGPPVINVFVDVAGALRDSPTTKSCCCSAGPTIDLFVEVGLSGDVPAMRHTPVV